MTNCRLLKSMVIGIFCLWSLSAYAIDHCDFEPPTSGIIDPTCQQTSMRGIWWAVPGKLIPPEQITQFQTEAISLEVPGYWPEEKVSVDADFPRGLVTLWTEIKLSGLNTNGEDLAIWPGRQSTAMRLYVDDGRGSWIKAFDNLSVFVKESDQPIYALPAAGIAGLLHSGSSFQLPKLYPGSRIILQLYVDDYRTGGVAQPPQIGLKDELYLDIMHRTSWHVLFLGACLLVTIFAASQAYFSSHRRAIHLFLMLMSLGAGLRLVVTGSFLAYLFPEFTVNHHSYLAWISFLFLLGIFIGAQVFMLPALFERYAFLKKALLFLSSVPALLVLLIPLLTMHEFLLIGHVLRIFYILVAFSYTLFLVWQVWLKPKEQWLQLLGIMTILVSGSYDAHLYVQNIDPYIELFSIAMFTFIVAQAMYFGWEHIRLFRREQRLTLNLQNLNESLEKQVSHRTKDLQTANERLSLAATTDVLTELPNRRAFDQELADQTLLAEKRVGDLCLAIIDIDWFKSVNDNYGHFVGDKVLQTLALYLRTKISEPDIVARIGGEEFAIIMPQSDLESAEKLLKQLCAGVTDVHTNGAEDYRLSISIGCAKWHSGLSMDELYKLSDQALYRAKNNGRGRVEIF